MMFMKKVLTVAVLALASALLLTNCSKKEEGKYYGLSEKELGELVVVGTSQTDMTTTGTSFVQALQAITGKQPTPYYKDTVKMKGDMRCVVRSYDGGSIQGVFNLYEGTELQIKNGTGTPVEEFSLEFSDQNKSIMTQIPNLEADLATDAPYLKFNYIISPTGPVVVDDKPAISVGEGAQQGIYVGRINTVIIPSPDIAEDEVQVIAK